MKKTFKRLLFVICVILVFCCYKSGITNADIAEAFDFSESKAIFATEVQPYLDNFTNWLGERLPNFHK